MTSCVIDSFKRVSGYIPSEMVSEDTPLVKEAAKTNKSEQSIAVQGKKNQDILTKCDFVGTKVFWVMTWTRNDFVELWN